VRLAPLLHGGGHEHGLRSGTLPVPLIVGFAKAVELAIAEREVEAERLTTLRERLLGRLRDGGTDLVVNGDLERRLPGNSNVRFPGVDADALLAALPDVAISTGSACASARPEPSPVLRALGLSEVDVRASVRIGLGRGTTVEEVDTAAERIVAAVRGLRAQRPRTA
jgi:cysteine desulfurase